MLRYISHEIRSPLMVVSINLQILLEDGRDMPESEFISHMKDAIDGSNAAIAVGKK